ncbi:L,D-transpeptidase [Tsukamurella asaccharolytica]|uniref:L,D-transpeptidase n=1 Tax=Tsukamurella asaccharolytica TaxID=2592067 RepID=A0A5C5RBS5_9ACTN|nr:L,D-transpeptidase [Tsukamurella asaccharolytica]TWS19833.1 L,D-transpeptidase [Tsukamurella asaccharolytica]
MTDPNLGPTGVSRRGFARLGAGAAAAIVAATASAAVAGAAPTTPSRPTEPSTPSGDTETSETPAASPQPPVATKTGWVALADDNTKQITIWHNGEVVKTMPTSFGTNKHPTPNGTYYTMEKKRDMYMDSSTYGVPVDSPEGYRTYVEYATRMSWSGIFVHAAPWSVNQQGVSNVSHGCLNVSTANGKYFYDNFPIGSPIVVRNTVGGQYTPGS